MAPTTKLDYNVEIDWPAGGWETVPLGVPGEIKSNDRIRTLETSAEIDYYARYETTVESISSAVANEYIIALRYRRDEQEGEAQTNEYWGTSTIIIDISNMTAKATWSDDRKNDIYNTTVIARLIPQEQFSERNMQQRTASLRDPITTRKIRALDVACVITDQTASTALEVAHILEVAKNGTDSISNCFLLRADLHRLFDSGQLRFTDDGRVDGDHLPRGYQEELQGLRINAAAFHRVRANLARRMHDYE